MCFINQCAPTRQEMFHQFPSPQPDLRTWALCLRDVSHPLLGLEFPVPGRWRGLQVTDSSSSPWLKEQGGWDAAQIGLSPVEYFPGMFSLVDIHKCLQS